MGAFGEMIFLESPLCVEFLKNTLRISLFSIQQKMTSRLGNFFSIQKTVLFRPFTHTIRKNYVCLHQTEYVRIIHRTSTLMSSFRILIGLL